MRAGDLSTFKKWGVEYTCVDSHPSIYSCGVKPLQELPTLVYDVIIIAVNDVFVAAEMQDQLLKFDIPKEMIVWFHFQEKDNWQNSIALDKQSINYGTNKIIGCFPRLERCTLKFDGENNILFCRPDVILSDSWIRFSGNNSVVCIKSFCGSISIGIDSDSSVFIGEGMTTASTAEISVEDNSNCYIGNDVMLSSGVSMRTGDSHMVFDCLSKKRSNKSQSIFVGDHVWIGWHSVLWKGTHIDSGSIIGVNSTIMNRKIGHNVAFAGNPGEVIKKDVFWDRHMSTNASSDIYPQLLELDGDNSGDRFIYEYDSKEEISFESIDTKLVTSRSADERLQQLLIFDSHKEKNRFVHVL